MMYVIGLEDIPVVVRNKTIWMDEESFNTMAGFRKERIDTGTRYNNGPTINDNYADAGEVLVSGGGVTVWELGVFSDGITILRKLFGDKWYLPEHGESRRNPEWMKDYYEEYPNG